MNNWLFENSALLMWIMLPLMFVSMLVSIVNVGRVSNKQTGTFGGEVDRQNFSMRQNGKGFSKFLVIFDFLGIMFVFIGYFAIWGYMHLSMAIVSIVIVLSILDSTKGVDKDRIDVKEDNITVVPLFGKTREFQFSQITRVEEDNIVGKWSDFIVHVNVGGQPQKFKVDGLMSNKEIFFERVRENPEVIIGNGEQNKI